MGQHDSVWTTGEERVDQIGCVSPSRVDDALDLLAKSNYFSTLDLATGYWEVSMAPESVE